MREVSKGTLHLVSIQLPEEADQHQPLRGLRPAEGGQLRRRQLRLLRSARRVVAAARGGGDGRRARRLCALQDEQRVSQAASAVCGEGAGEGHEARQRHVGLSAPFEDRAMWG